VWLGAAGRFTYLQEYPYPVRTFNSFGDSLLTLVAMLIGDGVQETILAVVDSASLMDIIFFLVYLIVVKIIIINLLISVLCGLQSYVSQLCTAEDQGPVTDLTFW
jgi:hypothetical protein